MQIMWKILKISKVQNIDKMSAFQQIYVYCLNMHVEIINFCFPRYCVTELSAVVDKSCCMSWRVDCIKSHGRTVINCCDRNDQQQTQVDINIQISIYRYQYIDINIQDPLLLVCMVYCGDHLLPSDSTDGTLQSRRESRGIQQQQSSQRGAGHV